MLVLLKFYQEEMRKELMEVSMCEPSSSHRVTHVQGQNAFIEMMGSIDAMSKFLYAMERRMAGDFESEQEIDGENNG